MCEVEGVAVAVVVGYCGGADGVGWLKVVVGVIIGRRAEALGVNVGSLISSAGLVSVEYVWATWLVTVDSGVALRNLYVYVCSDGAATAFLEDVSGEFTSCSCAV